VSQALKGLLLALVGQPMPRLLLAHEVKTKAAITATRREIIIFFINKTDFECRKINQVFGKNEIFIHITTNSRISV
jgi:hypothetical protein